MKPEKNSQTLLKVTRSKAKMFEYNVPISEHIKPPRDLGDLLTLTIGILGELSARINTNDIDNERHEELQSSMLFAARYFDAFRQTQLQKNLDPYLLLIGATSYYLCALPGSSKVLASHLAVNELDLGASSLEQLLLWLVQGEFNTPPVLRPSQHSSALSAISEAIVIYYNNGGNEDALRSLTARLRQSIYADGSARELLLVDAIGAMTLRRYENSSRRCLPHYSALEESDWATTLSKASFVHELWPAQRLLGENEIFKGRSAIVQMPTSAGKSRATEITIRSAFISGRASLAIIVAPFRALCHEIRDNLSKAFRGEPVNIDELSDASQVDFDINEVLAMRSVLIVTPEKLVYVLRHEPQLASQIGLLVYDEGHQFDTGTRGVTYELLLTSLKEMVPPTIQTILISAVMPNADSIGNWLNPDQMNTVSGENLIPTERTIAFTSWQDHLGRLEFIDNDNPDQSLFFVPRVLEPHQLQRQNRQREQFFPDRFDGNSIALYLGLKLVKHGSIAIFCGRKDTATNICSKLINAYRQNLSLDPPSKISDASELLRIAKLCERNLGNTATITQSAQLGVFTHHGNTPHGLRLAVEHAMSGGKIRFIVCTSTLAQGVNLPIKYLIITSFYQGQTPIKTRDFHNLIGRTGRSGMHTEGSVIFSDPAIFDNKGNTKERWRWLKAKQLLRPSNSEPCNSSLLALVKPLKSTRTEHPADPLIIPQAYVAHPRAKDWEQELAATLAQEGFSQNELQVQIEQRAEAFSTIESFLMAHWDTADATDHHEDINRLTQATLAYHLADDTDREALLKLFQILADHIARRAEEPARKSAYSRTLLGVDEAANLEAWISSNIENLSKTDSTDRDLIVLIWPLIIEYTRSRLLRKCRPPQAAQEITQGWLNGDAFSVIHDSIASLKPHVGDGDRPRKLTIENIVEICENALAFDGAMLIGAIAEVTNYLRPEDELLRKRLELLQKRMKYGLPQESHVAIYESGFSDRVVADDISQIIGQCSSRRQVIRELHSKESAIRTAIDRYPDYFRHILDQLLK